MNLYAYVGNNPINYIDPYGLWFIIDDVVTGPVDEIIVLGLVVVYQYYKNGSSNYTINWPWHYRAKSSSEKTTGTSKGKECEKTGGKGGDENTKKWNPWKDTITSTEVPKNYPNMPAPGSKPPQGPWETILKILELISNIFPGAFK